MWTTACTTVLLRPMRCPSLLSTSMAMLDNEATVKVFKQRDGHTWLLPRNSAARSPPTGF